MARYIRADTYVHKPLQWKVINDVDDNDFTPLVNTIVQSNKSINIDGRAGTGKSTLIRKIQDNYIC